MSPEAVLSRQLPLVALILRDATFRKRREIPRRSIAAKSSIREDLSIKSVGYDRGTTCAHLISAVPRSDKLMLRITENSENGKTVRFRLDGTLTAASYSELEALCSQYQGSDGKIILLDMAGVVFMSDEVARKVLELRTDRLSIINCSPFIETLLKTSES